MVSRYLTKLLILVNQLLTAKTLFAKSVQLVAENVLSTITMISITPLSRAVVVAQAGGIKFNTRAAINLALSISIRTTKPINVRIVSLTVLPVSGDNIINVILVK